MLTTLTNDVRAEVALAWLEAPDVASLGIEENKEPTFAETMAAIVEERRTSPVAPMAANGVTCRGRPSAPRGFPGARRSRR